jgi:kynurenine formamidase
LVAQLTRQKVQEEIVMRLMSALTGIAFVTSIAMASSAFAQSDCTKTVPVSPFGKDDQTGATNRITPAVTKAAAAEIKDGKVTSLTNPLVDGVPLFGTRFTKTVLTATGLAPGGSLGKNELTYMEDTWLSQSHVGTHLDGVGHIGRADCYYNQNAMGKNINQNYMTKLGLENLKSFQTRGVFIDMVKVYQQANKLKSNPNCRTPCLDKGTVITPEDLQAGLKLTNTTLREGDIVIIHTGWVDLFAQHPAKNAEYNSGEAGLGKAAAKWLIDQKIVAVGVDNWAVEVIPGESQDEAFPVHQMLLTDNGIHIIENVRTDLMAAEVGRTNRGTFFFSMTVPKAVGLTGTFVAIDAIQ